MWTKLQMLMDRQYLARQRARHRTQRRRTRGTFFHSARVTLLRILIRTQQQPAVTNADHIARAQQRTLAHWPGVDVDPSRARQYLQHPATTIMLNAQPG